MFSLLEDNKSNIKLSLARIGILSYVTVWLFVYCILYMRCAINCVHFWIFCVIFWLYSYHIFTIFTFNMHVQNLAVPHQKLICICKLMTINFSQATKEKFESQSATTTTTNPGIFVLHFPISFSCSCINSMHNWKTNSYQVTLFLQYTVNKHFIFTKTLQKSWGKLSDRKVLHQVWR